LSRIVLILFTLIFITRVTVAQNNDVGILMIWNDSLMLQTIADGQLQQTVLPTQEDEQYLAANTRNIYSFETSPVVSPLENNFGFYQGLWSPERTQFVFIAIAPNSSDYQVILRENDQQQILVADQVGVERGYLVPIAWADNGNLVLLERFMLHNLDNLRVWQYDFANGGLTVSESLALPQLKGKTATLSGGWVFIGFDTVALQGYLFNINTSQISIFNTSVAFQDPPASVFETYPIEVIGITSVDTFENWLANRSTQETPTPELTTPFLHHPLPDHARAITCYPDSEWTDSNFPVECPGLTVPREYRGHEGTDVGGKPNGLALGTPVYAAAPGLIVKTLNNCPTDDITCGDAYGNYVLIEHTRVIDNNTETWFTGYAHLQEVLVEPNTYIDQIGIPIALSGDTGFGGAHLHFEVRSPQHPSKENWLDPWDQRLTVEGTGLWITDGTIPIASVVAFPPPTLLTCQTISGNNIRSGPDVTFDIVAKSEEVLTYEVFQIQTIASNQAPGEWYHVRWQNSEISGWIWADLMNDCSIESSTNTSN